METSSKPNFSILFVHGAWHTPAFFGPMIELCRKNGYEAICPRLPTCNFAALEKNPDLTMQDDANTIRESLEHLILEQGKKVVIVAHSYGTVPSTEAATRELGTRHQASNNKRGGIVGILHLSGLLVRPNMSLEDLSGGTPPPFIIEHNDGLTTTDDPVRLFLHDLGADEQQQWAAMLVPQPRKAHKGILSQGVFDDFPVGYVVLDNDQATPVFAQQLCLKIARDAGVTVHEYHLPTGHSPFLSHPKLLLETIEQFAGI